MPYNAVIFMQVSHWYCESHPDKPTLPASKYRAETCRSRTLITRTVYGTSGSSYSLERFKIRTTVPTPFRKLFRAAVTAMHLAKLVPKGMLESAKYQHLRVTRLRKFIQDIDFLRLSDIEFDACYLPFF